MSIFAKLREGVTTASAAETHALARELAAALPPDSTLALHGDLGVGKTTFVQGLARGLGVTDPVTSPTFNIFTLYKGGARTLVHMDAYRLENDWQIDALMLEDFLVSPWCLAVEWPEKIAAWIPANALHLELGITPDQRHTIRLLG
ncbi:tRNA (adenosine(37)-N6)-threonylcarbamoyltransferase complex ATPase subunit type 1 TsaE [Rariglobus hedericola]|uniref:tRNA threonylcarbamoyladenosine biosynthesis protein TsaE n=1 Tax=Rariglobus hedericola TaxID=2597822 RepID=A0A556QQH3_9BACT|nr:tRNA (adenosine(37)-N6)-threonylcarbamoyltransferase complex ATPase subunit type 1 TsaE [Rariglobus hedericola]TSJ78897.1 tRNA (adenosine(37)-N6)-threonylcarbamoyltransferase complex ATPase subunit type 1 TsaE [Rariglobus hedericola]